MNLFGGGKIKFVFQSHVDKNNAVDLSDTEKRTIGKTDNVKTSPDRQVKAQTSRKSGCIIAGGSDAPVERGEPMIEFYAAVARKSVKGVSAEGWHPEQAVSREQALKMFTLWPAYAAFEENDKGSIEPGKLADFTVLSNDIMKIPEPEILKTRCVMTIIGGEIVFEDRGFD